MLSAIILTVLGSLLYINKAQFEVEILQRLEAIPYDIRLKLGTPIKTNDLPPIIIIDINEESLKKEGRWPWSRKKLGQLIDKLYKNNTAIVMLDIVQSEKEISPVTKIKKALTKINKPIPEWFNQIEKSLDADSYFSKIIEEKELALGFLFHLNLKTKTGKLHPGNIKSDTKNIQALTTIDMQGYTSNLEQFAKHASSGFINTTSSTDGVVRYAPIIASFNNQVYPSLALETARLYLFEDSIELHTASIGNIRTITHLSLGRLIIPTDAKGQILIPYLGKQKHFPYISATKLLHSTQTFPELESAIAIVGTSATTLADLRSTPVQANFPGVEIQANILHGILHPESIANTPDWTDGATLVSLVLLCSIMILIYPMLQPLSLVISGTSLLFIMFAFNYWLWASKHISLPIIMPLLLIMTVSSIYVIYDLFKENKERRQIHDMFGQYVPLEHINKLIENPKAISTDGEKREMTVLFSDIRNFTKLSEPLTTGELKTFLNQYLTQITKVIFDNKGTIDKYVGDMVMAFWGAPLRNPDHASQAVLAALQMQLKISKMKNKFNKLGIKNVAAGIGIHTGEMNVGDMGSDYRRAYTVLGDAVNLGSRLESLTKYYDVKILVSENTKKQCKEIAFRYIDNVRVKGKHDSVKIFEPIATYPELTPNQHNQLQKHTDCFSGYLEGDWEKAQQCFQSLYQETHEPLYLLYIERIEQHEGRPPKNWKGIFIHQHK